MKPEDIETRFDNLLKAYLQECANHDVTRAKLRELEHRLRECGSLSERYAVAAYALAGADQVGENSPCCWANLTDIAGAIMRGEHVDAYARGDLKGMAGRLARMSAQEKP